VVGVVPTDQPGCEPVVRARVAVRVLFSRSADEPVDRAFDGDGEQISDAAHDSPSSTARHRNTAVAEVDPVTGTSSNPVVTISGQVDVSEQLLDRSLPPIDAVIGAELGRSYGEDFDLQVLNGTGAGQMTGLLGTAGITAITATTATAVANLAACGKLVADVSTSFGAKPDVLVVHPRRAAFVRTTLGYSPAPWPSPTVIEAPGMPVTLGGTQDAIVTLVREQVVLYTSPPPQVRVMADVLSGTLTVRISAFGYCSMIVRQPASVGKATGVGLDAPVFTL
jgi:Phage capsid family